MFILRIGTIGETFVAMNNIHIGEIIKQKFEESGMSIVEFSSKINRTRSTIYDIFGRKSIDVDLLLKISEVLKYNFMEKVYIQHPKSSKNLKYFLAIEVDEEELSSIDIIGEVYLLKQMIKDK